MQADNLYACMHHHKIMSLPIQVAMIQLHTMIKIETAQETRMVTLYV